MPKTRLKTMKKWAKGIEKNFLQPELFYLIPWPMSQKLTEMDPSQLHWSYSDIDYPAGAFVEKEWFDQLSS